MSMKLRDLIRAVRSCKTAAEERGVISTECAMIRTAIKEEDEANRHRNVAKLMYIHMLGYPTHFGQMECLKLISAPGFPEKRIGYLALTLLLTEQTELLTLVTNSLQLDLGNSNQYIQSLSLIAIGNMATQDMARDLSSDVEKLLKSNNSYLRKKAALATIRLIRKEPDLIDHMSERIVALLKDRTHGVLLTGMQLMIEVLEIRPDMKAEYAKHVPTLVRLLRGLITMGFSPEHDVGGIVDPFMQVKILNLLRRLGKGNEEASESMNDVLTQVATNTETAKNAGNAILYECVQTIMDVQSDSGLRVLAVNILGRFLLNRDNNIRYVALNSLSRYVSDPPIIMSWHYFPSYSNFPLPLALHHRVVTEDIAAVQRHRNTIVECLKDADISIRQRALELIYQLVNESNVVVLATELLNYLIVAAADQKPSLVSKILQIVEKYSPSKKWRVDTIVTMLTVAGTTIDDSVARAAILFIAQAEGLQGYATHRLYLSLQEDTSQMGLLQAGIWCIGEYGELLARQCPAFEGETGSQGGYPGISEPEIIAMLDKLMKLHNSDTATKALALNALIKLTVRLSPSSRPALSALIEPYKSSMAVELQQRSVEYSKLLTSQWDGIRANLLGKMPVLDEATLRKKRQAYDESANVESSAASSSTFSGSNLLPSPAKVGGGGGGGGSLLDLDDIFGGGAPLTVNPALGMLQPQPIDRIPSNMPSAQGPAGPTSIDLLSDIFSLSANVGPTPPAAPMPMMGGMGAMMGGMGSMGAVAQRQGNSGAASLDAFNKGGFQVTMDISKPEPANPSVTRVVCKFANLTPSPLEQLVFQVSRRHSFVPISSCSPTCINAH